MKRNVLFFLSMPVFVAMMAFNIQQIEQQKNNQFAGISLKNLQLMPTTAQAEGTICEQSIIVVYSGFCSNGQLHEETRYYSCEEGAGGSGDCERGVEAFRYNCSGAVIYYYNDLELITCG